MFSPSLARLELSCLARIVHQNRLSTADLDYGPLWNAARDLARLFQDLEGLPGGPVTVAGLRLSLLPP